MGLDINIVTDNYREIASGLFRSQAELDKYSLSRTFCKLVFREFESQHDSELYQIGIITNVDISPILDMATYPEEAGVNYLLETAKNEEEKQSIIANDEAIKEAFKGNIEIVKFTVLSLLDKFNKISNIETLLVPVVLEAGTLRAYFSNSNEEEPKYFNKSFAKDLSKLVNFLNYAENKSSSTVWFDFG